MIDIKSTAGEVLLSVPILQGAVSHEELMASDYVQLEWASDSGDVLPAGTYIEYEGERYSLLSPYHPTMQNEAAFRYTPQFHSRIIRWQKIIVPVYTYNENGVSVKSRELDWSFTGTPADLMSMIIRAIYEETGETWYTTLGDNLPETVSITAQSSSVWSLLSELAEQCETEWWAQKATNWLYLSKCEHSAAVTLEVGNNVRVPSVTSNDKEYFTRFYAFGSTRNITQDDGVVQGSIVNKRLTLDPKKYPDGYKDIKGHMEGGKYVSDLLPEEVLVKTLYFDDIYPSSTLTIYDVRKRMRYRLDSEENKIRIGGTDEAPIYEQYAIWYFKISGFNFTEDLIIEGLTLSAAFKSGKLRGREFELAYHAEAKKVADYADVDPNFEVEAGEYEIIFQESDGFILPDDDYITPSKHDEVTLFNINMPEEYKASARLKLEEELDRAIEEYTKDNNTYEFGSNPVEFYNDNTDVKLGSRVTFINGGSVLSTRVLMVEKQLDFACEQKIRIGNVRISGSRQQLRDEVRNIGEEVSRLSKVESATSIIQRDHTRDLMLTMGRYYAMRDTIGMLQNALEGYTGGINPVTIETMAMLVGDESLQFRFTASRNDLTPLDKAPFEYDAETKTLKANACALIHMTLGITTQTAKGVRKASDYKSWNMEGGAVATLKDAEKAYYVYARVEKEGTIGSYKLYEKPVKMEAEAGVYHFLVGILNAEYVGTRELITLYGFTEILPSRITTDRIESADGSCYFDLLKNEIGGVINFKAGSSGVENLGIQTGSYNLLRNSGFTGDYLSETLTDEAVLNAATEMYNDRLVHWDNSTNVVVQEEAESASGYAVYMQPYSVLTQQLYYNSIAGENYVLSFRAKGVGALNVQIAGKTSSVVLDSADEYKRYNLGFVASASNTQFVLQPTAAILLCELQLERGTVSSAWGNSWLDNSSDRAYWQSMKYLQSAMEEGYTEIGGGLILTNHIQVGDTANGQMTGHAPTGGMNGLMSDGKDSVFLWGGGTLQQAQNTVKGYKDNENWQPTEGELQALAKFVVTHGGRAILNDMILRGYVYALGGKIGGLEIKDGGIYTQTNTGGEVLFTPVGLIARQADGSFTELGTCGSHAIMVNGKDAGGQCYLNEDLYKIAAQINAANGYHAIHSLSGMYAGLRPNIRKITASDILTELDHTVILSNAGTITLTLPSSPQTGQTYKIIHTNTNGVLFSHPDGDMIINVYEGGGTVMTSFEEQKTLTLTYLDHIWYAEINN